MSNNGRKRKEGKKKMATGTMAWTSKSASDPSHKHARVGSYLKKLPVQSSSDAKLTCTHGATAARALDLTRTILAKGCEAPATHRFASAQNILHPARPAHGGQMESCAGHGLLQQRNKSEDQRDQRCGSCEAPAHKTTFCTAMILDLSNCPNVVA